MTITKLILLAFVLLCIAYVVLLALDRFLRWMRRERGGEAASGPPRSSPERPNAYTKARLTGDMALGELFPSSGEYSQICYCFASQFLPGYIHQNPRAFFAYNFDASGFDDPTEFIQSRWYMMEQRLGLLDRMNGDLGPGERFGKILDLSAWKTKLDERPAFLVEMPKPMQGTDSIFVGAVLDVEGDKVDAWLAEATARVFALEKLGEAPETTSGILCEWTDDGTHMNFGTMEIPATRDAFETAMLGALR